MGFKLKQIGNGREKSVETRTIPVAVAANATLTLAKDDVLAVVYTEGASSSYTITAAVAKLGHQTKGVGFFCVTKAVSYTDSGSGSSVDVTGFDIEPDMIFETVAGADLSSCVVGAEYLLNSSGKLSTSVAGMGMNNTASYRGVILYDKTGATAENKPVLVKFPSGNRPNAHV